MGKQSPKADEDDVQYDTSTGSRVPGIIFGTLVALPGIYFLLRGYGVIRVPGRPGWWTDPSEILQGATLLGAGAWLTVLGLELSGRARRAVWHAIWVVLAMVYTWAITIVGFDALSYTSIGPMSGVQFWRAACFAFDLYVALSLINSVFDEMGSAPAAKRNKLAYAAGCLAVAFTLELSGGLAKLYAKLGLQLPGPVATIGLLQATRIPAALPVPDLRLEEFAGDWVGVFHKHMPQKYARGINTIARVHVAVANGEARVQIWRACAQQECDGGSFPAIIESRRRGTVVGLHLTGTMNGTDWLMSLSTQKDHLLLTEWQIRGRDMNTRYQFSDWMSRPDDVRLK